MAGSRSGPASDNRSAKSATWTAADKTHFAVGHKKTGPYKIRSRRKYCRCLFNLYIAHTTHISNGNTVHNGTTSRHHSDMAGRTIPGITCRLIFFTKIAKRIIGPDGSFLAPPIWIYIRCNIIRHKTGFANTRNSISLRTQGRCFIRLKNRLQIQITLCLIRIR